MESGVEREAAAKLDRLRTERTILKECTQSYDRLIAQFESGGIESVVFSEAIDRTAITSQLTKLTNILNATELSTADSDERSRTVWFRRRLLRQRINRCCIAILTLGIMLTIWWQLQWQTRSALTRLEGVWQQVDVTKTGEEARTYYRAFTTGKMAASSIRPTRRTSAHANEFELTPSSDFFTCRLYETSGRDRVTRGSFYVQILDDKLYELRGLHPNDSMRIPKANLWRQIDSFPIAAPTEKLPQ